MAAGAADQVVPAGPALSLPGLFSGAGSSCSWSQRGCKHILSFALKHGRFQVVACWPSAPMFMDRRIAATLKAGSLLGVAGQPVFKWHMPKLTDWQQTALGTPEDTLVSAQEAAEE